MLKEHLCRQVPHDYFRRWFSDDYLDLIVWLKPDGGFYGFQLCYDKSGRERAWTWISPHGYSHRAMDGGGSGPFSNCTPILNAEEPMPVELVQREFLARSGEMDPAVRQWVVAKLEEYALPHSLLFHS